MACGAVAGVDWLSDISGKCQMDWTLFGPGSLSNLGEGFANLVNGGTRKKWADVRASRKNGLVCGHHGKKIASVGEMPGPISVPNPPLCGGGGGCECDRC